MGGNIKKTGKKLEKIWKIIVKRLEIKWKKLIIDFGLIRKEFGKRIRRLSLYIKSFIKTGKPERYHCNTEAALKAGIALAGPMFISALIGIGGLY